MAPRNAAGQAAKAQRNKGGPHKDAKAQRKNPFAAWRLCAQKIKCLEEEKFKLAFTH
jgi:hypothetical protein